MELKHISVSNADGNIYKLRLTLAGQKALKKAHKQDALDVLMAAITDGEVMADVLQQASHYAGADVAAGVTGETIYNELVDSGYHGQLPWAKLAIELAECSGLIDADQAAKLLKRFDRALAGMLDSLDDEETPQSSPEASV